jgi:hypothetical protein
MAASDEVSNVSGNTSPNDLPAKEALYDYEMHGGDDVDENYSNAIRGFTEHDKRDMSRMGKTQELRVRLYHLLLMSSHFTPPAPLTALSLSERFSSTFRSEFHRHLAGHMGSPTGRKHSRSYRWRYSRTHLVIRLDLVRFQFGDGFFGRDVLHGPHFWGSIPLGL